MPYIASNSFKPEEVAAMVRLFRKLDTPTNRDLLNVKEVRAVQGKFLRMAAKLEAEGAATEKR